MINIDGKEFRNLQEQVGKNKADIDEIKQSLGSALPDPIPGPQGEPGASIIGPQGPRGEKGERGFKGDQGPMGAGWTSITEIDGTDYTPTVVEDSDSFMSYETNIDIICDGNTHTATLKLELPKDEGEDYTAGSGIDIDADNVISAKVKAGTGIVVDDDSDGSIEIAVDDTTIASKSDLLGFVQNVKASEQTIRNTVPSVTNVVTFESNSTGPSIKLKGTSSVSGTIQVNPNSDLYYNNKKVAMVSDIPTKISDLTNDNGSFTLKGYIHNNTLPVNPQKGDVWIAMNDITFEGIGELTPFKVGDTFDNTSAIYFDTSISDADMSDYLWSIYDDPQIVGYYPLVYDSVSDTAIVAVDITGVEPYLYAPTGSNYSVIWAGDNSVTGAAGWQNVDSVGKAVLAGLFNSVTVDTVHDELQVWWNGVITGSNRETSFKKGDWLYYDGTNWKKADNQDYSTVISSLDSDLDNLSLQVTNNSNAIANIKDNMYGVNLLDNSNFKINQLGKASYTVTNLLAAQNVRTLDRWTLRKTAVLGKTATLTVNSNSIDLTTTNSVRFYQVINNDLMKQLEGRYLRFSRNVDGTIFTGVFENAITNAAYAKSTITLNAANGLTVALEKVADSYFTLSLYNDSASSQTYSNIYWVKLEVENSGIGRTPYIIPDPVLELQKCQAYQQILMDGGLSALDIGFLIATNNFRVVYKPIVEFVSTPTLVTGTVSQREIAYTTSSIVTLSAFALNQYTTKRTILFDCTPSSTAIAAGTPGFLRSKQDDTSTAYLYVNFGEAMPS